MGFNISLLLRIKILKELALQNKLFYSFNFRNTL